jgi:hypothetical protein
MNKTSLDNLLGRLQPLSNSQETQLGGCNLALTYGLSPVYQKKVSQSKAKNQVMSSTHKFKDQRINETELTRLERRVERLKQGILVRNRPPAA